MASLCQAACCHARLLMYVINAFTFGFGFASNIKGKRHR